MRGRILSSLLLFSFLGCGHNGPLVTDCTPRPKNLDFLCKNESSGKELNMPPLAVDNWIFVSAADQLSMIKACSNKTGWPKMNVCSFSAAAMGYICWNEVTQKADTILFADSDGMIGVSPVDEQILLTFCGVN